MAVDGDIRQFFRKRERVLKPITKAIYESMPDAAAIAFATARLEREYPGLSTGDKDLYVFNLQALIEESRHDGDRHADHVTAVGDAAYSMSGSVFALRLGWTHDFIDCGIRYNRHTFRDTYTSQPQWRAELLGALDLTPSDRELPADMDEQTKKTVIKLAGNEQVLTSDKYDVLQVKFWDGAHNVFKSGYAPQSPHARERAQRKIARTMAVFRYTAPTLINRLQELQPAYNDLHVEELLAETQEVYNIPQNLVDWGNELVRHTVAKHGALIEELAESNPQSYDTGKLARSPLYVMKSASNKPNQASA
jgi:hypothetical protein